MGLALYGLFRVDADADLRKVCCCMLLLGLRPPLNLNISSTVGASCRFLGIADCARVYFDDFFNMLLPKVLLFPLNVAIGIVSSKFNFTLLLLREYPADCARLLCDNEPERL